MNLADLPPTVPIWDDDPDAPSARLFFPDLARGTLYEAARRDEIPVLRIGRRLLCPTARLLELVGADTNGKEVVRDERADEIPQQSETRPQPGSTTT